jgi:hypothetical protein
VDEEVDIDDSTVLRASDWLGTVGVESAATQRAANVEVQLMPSRGVEGVVWEAAKILTRCLVARPSMLLHGHIVLELGAGTGVAGLVARALLSEQEKTAPLLASPVRPKVYLTDRAAALPLLKRNIERNAGMAASARELDWISFAEDFESSSKGSETEGSETAGGVKNQIPPGVTTVLGADLTYDVAARPFLAHVLGRVPQSTQIVLAHCCRGDGNGWTSRALAHRALRGSGDTDAFRRRVRQDAMDECRRVRQELADLSAATLPDAPPLLLRCAHAEDVLECGDFAHAVHVWVRPPAQDAEVRIVAGPVPRLVAPCERKCMYFEERGVPAAAELRPSPRLSSLSIQEPQMSEQ